MIHRRAGGPPLAGLRGTDGDSKWVKMQNNVATRFAVSPEGNAWTITWPMRQERVQSIRRTAQHFEGLR
jgi:hypothetical protein